MLSSFLKILGLTISETYTPLPELRAIILIPIPFPGFLANSTSKTCISGFSDRYITSFVLGSSCLRACSAVVYVASLSDVPFASKI